MMWTGDPVRDQMRYDWEQEMLARREEQNDEWPDDWEEEAHDDFVSDYR